MMQISSMKVALLALVIATYVEPSASPPQDDEDFEVFDSDEFQESEYPRDANALKEKAMRKSEDYYNYEDSPQVKDKDMRKSDDYYDNHEDDFHVKHKMRSDRKKHKDKDMRKSDYYDNTEDDSHVKHKMSYDRKHKDTYKSISNEEFLDYLPAAASEKTKGNPKSELDFKRMIQFPWIKGRKGKPNGESKIMNQYCRISPPTERPGGCHRSTTDRCSSTFSLPPSTPSCPYTSKPTAPPPPPPPMSPSPPPPPPPTPKPPPPPCPPDQSNNKCPQKPKFKKLKPKTAKKLLKLILDTKQHVLFMLEILNHLENEVLFRSPDSSHRQYCKMKSEAVEKGTVRAVPKKKSAKPHKKQAKPEKQAKLQSYGEYHRKGNGNPYMPMARARANKLRQKEHLAAIDPEDNWRPAVVSSQANRAKNFMEPSGLSKHSHKKYRHHGQKQQPKMKNIPPGMVAILT